MASHVSTKGPADTPSTANLGSSPATATFPSSSSQRPDGHRLGDATGHSQRQRPPFSLIEVGFWADPRDPQDIRPEPSQFVDKNWAGTVESRAVALYLRSGFLESFELGYSFCRIGDGCFESGPQFVSPRLPAGCRGGGRRESGFEDNVGMGCCTLTDGIYVWPEGFAHYLERHAVRPPPEFVARAIDNLWALRKAQERGRLRWISDHHGRGTTVALEPATAVFLKDRTTVGLALPVEEEPQAVELKGGLRDEPVCSCVPS